MEKRKIICPVCEELLVVDYGICPYCSNNMVIPDDDLRDKEIENRIAKEIDEEKEREGK